MPLPMTSVSQRSSAMRLRGLLFAVDLFLDLVEFRLVIRPRAVRRGDVRVLGRRDRRVLGDDRGRDGGHRGVNRGSNRTCIGVSGRLRRRVDGRRGVRGVLLEKLATGGCEREDRDEEERLLVHFTPPSPTGAFAFS